MQLDAARVRTLLKERRFTDLFVEELGWSRCRISPIDIEIDGRRYRLDAVSEMGGFVAFKCDELPDYHIRRKIDREVTRRFFEHIIIYCGEDRQVWQWVKKESGKPSAVREQEFRYNQSGTPLIQKLDGIAFSLEELDEDGNISITSVAQRIRSAFDVDKVTKRFYDRFKSELEQFKGFIKGLPDRAQLDWYSSLMMNRLMFIYFIQKKGFLDGDTNYLRNRLRMVQERRGRNHFFSFYRSFLRVLFHEGLNSPIRTRELEELIGTVPYLDGGLFEEHEIERENPELDIPDEAFEKLFDFFDQYEWHLDTRPMRNDQEINPDVLGYIFEKYVNQKQMGAYYTKEDITEYIAKNTIIPYLFDAAQKKCAIAFEGEHSVWDLLMENPDRYIYPAMKLGVIDSHGNVIPESALPDFVQVGMHNPRARMFDRRYNLTEADLRDAEGNKLTLPTETWREYVNRRNRCLEVRAKLANGQVQSIDDLITYNLDIRQFAQDVIENTESPDLLRAFWESIRTITVLDPTCGSGAFLFAALNILQPLYEACLGRMREFLELWGEAGKRAHPNYYKWFSDTLRRAEEHPNLDYFILKSIILNNLYGVDIMREAVEICKLRLFLKLAAQVDPDPSRPNMGLEPLPDIDFNIRAGNTLVGFATYDEVQKAVSSALDFDETAAAIDRRAQEVDELFALFRQQQEELGGEITARDKQELRERLRMLDDELNRYLARQYGDAALKNYDAWLASHQPFHWFVEFYGIMKRGGFDVIIGNPPYVEYSKVRSQYTIKGYATEPCGNLYAFVIERCLRILTLGGRKSMIVQLPLICTDRMIPVQNQLVTSASTLWFASFDDRPARLFDGLEHIRATIYIAAKTSSSVANTRTTAYTRWYSPFRKSLFDTLHFADLPTPTLRGAIPKIGETLGQSIFERLLAYTPLGQHVSSVGSYRVYFHNAPQYWIRAMDFAPYFWNERDGEQISTQLKTLGLADATAARSVTAAMNASLFYWWFVILSDCRHLNDREVRSFPLGLEDMPADIKHRLAELAVELMEDYRRHKKRKECHYKATGRVVYDEFYPKYSKPIIDQIDCVLAEHYGFTDEELDFIINYDIKYRMGLYGDEDDGGLNED